MDYIVTSLIETKRILEANGFEDLELINSYNKHIWGISDPNWGTETYTVIYCDDGEQWYTVIGEYESTNGETTLTYRNFKRA